MPIKAKLPYPVLVIPQSALVEANGQQLVFVQNGNRFQPVEVTLGRRAGNLIEVESGLFDGDRVVTQRANQLYAQSLRGGTAKADHAASPEVSVADGALPGWILILGSGALAIALFVAGAFWANRQNQKRLRSTIEELEPLENHPNRHHQPVLHTAETHPQESDSRTPPY